MTREEALKRIEELETFRKLNYPNMTPILELYQDLAKAHNLSLEELTERMMVVGGGVGQARPIRAKETSCKNCKYYVEIAPLYGLSDIFATEEKEPMRLCYTHRLGEPILGDKWQHGCVCFSPRNKA